ncbi:MAG: PTS sugar transporter subunit IIB, partial [Gemmatimonadota bacterium]
QAGADRVMLLTRDIGTMNRLAATGLLQGEAVNIGGVHHAPDRQRVLRYVFLSDRERDELRELSGRGARVEARDVPTGRPVGLDDLVGAR